MQYLLELRNAQRIDTGVYRWSFSHQNLFRADQLTVGPTSVTCEHDYRNVVVLSNTFRDSSLPHVNRGDSLRPVVTVIHPEFRSTHAPDSVAGAGGGSSGSAEQGSDQAIDDMFTAGTLLAWTDMANSRMFDINMVPSTGPGSNVNYIYDRKNSSLIWTLAYGQNMKVVQIGSANGIYKDGSWQSYVDNSPLGSNINLADEFCVHFLFQQNSINDYTVPLFFSDIKVAMYQGALSYFKASTNYIAHVVPGVTIIPLQPYLISVHRRAVANGLYEFYWRVEKLSDASVQESTTEPTTVGSVSTNQQWRLGVAATSFHHYHGPMLIHNGLITADAENCRAWIRNHYNGGTTEAPGGGGSTTVSQWYQLYDTRKTTFKMQPQGFSDVVSTIELEFENHLGERFDPKDFVIHIKGT